MLADFLEVDPQYEKATEEFLHDELEYVVVRDWAEAERGIELMRGESERARDISGGSAGRDGAEPADACRSPGREAGVLTKLTDALRFTNGLTKSALASAAAHCAIVMWRRIAAVAQQLAVRVSALLVPCAATA